MGRSFVSRFGLLLLFMIIVLLLLEKFTSTMPGELGFRAIAGIISLAIGAFAFTKMIVLTKKNKFGPIIFQVIMILLGIVLVIDQSYDLLIYLNSMMDVIVILFYILTLLLVAYFTANEKVGQGEIREAELLREREEQIYSKKKRRI